MSKEIYKLLVGKDKCGTVVNLIFLLLHKMIWYLVTLEQELNLQK